MTLSKLGNYNIFLASNSLLALATGLLGPFYIVFVQNFAGGNMGQFGFSVGLAAFAYSVAAYYVGKYSDKLGRKIFLILGGFSVSGVILAYTLITSAFQLYLLQIINGLVSSMQGTMETAFLADITKKASRGADIGKYHALVGVIASITMMASGFIVGSMGFKVIFYITAAIVFVSTIALFYIKE